MSSSLVSPETDFADSNTDTSTPPSPSHLRDISTMDTVLYPSAFLDALEFYRKLPSSDKPPMCWPAAHHSTVPRIFVSHSDELFPCNGGNIHYHSEVAVPLQRLSEVDSPSNLSPSSVSSAGTRDYVFQTTCPPTRTLYDVFVSTRSRVVQVRKEPHVSFLSLVSMFEACGQESRFGRLTVPPPSSMWIANDMYDPDEAWVVFKSHSDACVFLSLSLPSITLQPALETDLRPLEKLRRVDLVCNYPSSPVNQLGGHSQHQLRMSLSTPDLHKRADAAQRTFVHGLPVTQTDDFVLSSNPPNPRTTFRLGDWICSSASCAAHNFGRNLACRGCGCPRSEGQVSSMNRQGSFGMPPTRLPASPRFVGAGNAAPFTQPSIPTSPLYPSIPHAVQPSSAPQHNVAAKPPSPSHPLLTPSGRSFAIGGKVQNVSVDPSCPCVMYWPDNEPFPEQGQIRPSNLVGVPQPPILNTGNRGPIEHQPGDWICLKCNYLNWRRRKVCQTCFPYAEGNGDSISAAVQAERINLLTSLLAQNQLPLNYNPAPAPELQRPQTMSPSQNRRLMGDTTPLTQAGHRSRSRSQHDPSVHFPDTQYIYETSGPRRASSSFSGMKDLEESLPPVPPAPLLPSFLQDIVQSPTLSPTSTSSADLSIEEYDDNVSSPGRSAGVRDRLVASNDSTSHLPLGNIWKLNDEETNGVAGIALPHHEELLVGRKSSEEGLRRRGSP